MKKTALRSDVSLVEQCYDLLQKEIIEGVLKPGQKIKVEPLKEQFLVGQSPIREALSRLVAVGLVEAEENKGFRVACISEEDIRDTYRTFTQIEILALTQAMQEGGPEWEASIVAALYRLSLVENNTKAVSYEQWVEANSNFHISLIAGCNSLTLMEIRKRLYLKFDRYCKIAFSLTQNALEANHEEHVKLAQAVLQRDNKVVQQLMVYHINGALEQVIEKMKQNKII
jgi:DNA-binding GntR family transcriptional regulator